jgi:hydrogenase expression/formation protein HypD
MSDTVKQFRNAEYAQKAAEKLSSLKGRPVKLMEVCGTHTTSIFKLGLRELLPSNIQLVSGPGCPVCVTPASYLDAAVKLSQMQNVMIVTFGDLLRVPGSQSSLQLEKADGRDIRVVYSPLDCLKLARENPGKQVVFLSVGFESTTPVVALSVQQAEKEGLHNFHILTANKTMPEALRILAEDPEVGIDGYLYPGHVSAVIGTSLFEEFAQKLGIPGVVAGFEPLDILYAIYVLTSDLYNGKVRFHNCYTRVVQQDGNPAAREVVSRVFMPCDAVWRGIGCIENSGLCLQENFQHMDAWKVFGLAQGETCEPPGCQCGEVLKGKKKPSECPLFGRSCTPEKPVGACMVSCEGSCAAYYRYGRGKIK